VKSSPLWPFWLRSSVVSVLNSLTTIIGALPLLLVILFFDTPAPWALLATWGCDDLAAAVLACVVGGPPLVFSSAILLLGRHLTDIHGWQTIFMGWSLLYCTKLLRSRPIPSFPLVYSYGLVRVDHWNDSWFALVSTSDRKLWDLLLFLTCDL